VLSPGRIKNLPLWSSSVSVALYATSRFPARLPILLYPATPKIYITPSTLSKMALFVDRYRPRSLLDLSYHHDLSSRLKSLVSYQTHSFINNQEKILMRHPVGAKRRFPSSFGIWTIGRWKEDTNSSYAQRTLRTRR
jgi:hypothetical protein